jgi:hypothetical protein
MAKIIILGIISLSFVQNCTISSVDLELFEKESISQLLVNHMQNNQGQDDIDYTQFKIHHSNEIVNNHSFYKVNLQADKFITEKLDGRNIDSVLKVFKNRNDSLILVPSLGSYDDSRNRDYILLFFYSKGFYNYFTVTVASVGKDKNYVDLNIYNDRRDYLVYKDKKGKFEIVRILTRIMN